MNKKNISKNILIGYSILIAQVATAQQVPIDSTKKLDEITVTASKILLTPKETAKIVQIITKEQLQQSSGKDLSQILNQQAGIVVNGSNSNPAKDKSVYMQGASPEYTLILIDGVPINDPSGVGGAFDIRLLPTAMIERIEILKGSQSTLYGTDAIAGVINIITKQDSQKPVNTYGGLSFGSYKTRMGNVGLSGSYGRQLSYNIGYQNAHSGGISEATDITEKKNFDNDGYTQNSFQSSVSFKPSNQLKITPFFRLTNFNGDYDADAFTDAPNSFKSKAINTGILTQWVINNFSINGNYTYNNTDRIYKTEYGENNYKGRFQNLDIFASYRFLQYLQVLTGFNYQMYKMVDSTLHNPNATIYSPYLTFLIKNYHGFSFEAGYRFVNHSKYGNNFTYSFAPAYQVNKYLKLFSSLTTGFKAPTLSQLYGQYGANEQLKPQKSISYEGGFLINAINNKIQIQSTIFKRQINDKIIYATKGYINQDQQTSHGIETSISWHINKIFTINSWYAFVNGNVKTQTFAKKDTSFSNLIRIPKNSFNIELQIKPNDKLYLSLQAQYAGDRTDNFYNPANFYSLEQVILKKYVLVNFYSEYKIKKRFTLYATLKNITNTTFTEVYGYNTQKFNFTTGIHFTY